MRVLHVVPSAPSGGTDGFTQRQIDRLSDAGICGKILCFGGAAMLRRPHKLPIAIVNIRRAIRNFKPDIVHAHWGSLLGFATGIASLGGPSVIVSYRGSDINPVPSEPYLRSLIRITFSQLAALNAAAVICVSEELKRRIWIPPRNVKIIPDGTDLSLFRPMSKEEARLKLGWPEKQPVIFFYEGGRPEVKRRDIADASIREVQKHIPHCRLEVLGTGMPHHLIPVLLSASDCLLMTSDFEGSPNIVREALACGLPVVSVDVGDVRRWLMDKHATRIVNRDPLELGDALVTIIKSGVRVTNESTKLDFSQEFSTRSVLNLYLQIIQNKSQG